MASELAWVDALRGGQRPLVPVARLVDVAVLLDKVGQAVGTSGAVRVEGGLRAVGALEVLQQRGEELPADVQLVVTDEVGVVVLETVLDEGLVCLRDVELGGVPVLVG